MAHFWKEKKNKNVFMCILKYDNNEIHQIMKTIKSWIYVQSY